MSSEMPPWACWEFLFCFFSDKKTASRNSSLVCVTTDEEEVASGKGWKTVIQRRSSRAGQVYPKAHHVACFASLRLRECCAVRALRSRQLSAERIAPIFGVTFASLSRGGSRHADSPLCLPFPHAMFHFTSIYAT